MVLTTHSSGTNTVLSDTPKSRYYSPDTIDVLGPLSTVAVAAAAASPGPVIMIWSVWALLGTWKRRAPLLATLTFASLMLGKQGVLGFDIMGMPITLAKLSAASLVFVLVRESHCRFRAPVAVWGAFALVLAMVGNTLWVAPNQPTAAITTVSVALNVGLVLALSGLSDRAAVTRTARACAIVFATTVVIYLPEGLEAARVSATDSAWTHRSLGPIGSHNGWAAALVVCTPMVAVVLDRWNTRAALGALVCFLVAAPIVVLHTTSRGAFIASLFVAPLVAYLLRQRWRILLTTAVASVALFFLFFDADGIGLRLSTLMQPLQEKRLGHYSIRVRRSLYSAAWELFKAQPITGVGISSFPEASQALHGRNVPFAPHNTYLQVACEMGLIGLSGLIAFISAVVAQARALFKSNGGDTAGVAAGAATGLLGAAALAVSSDLLSFSPAWLMLGLLVAQANTASTHTDRNNDPL